MMQSLEIISINLWNVLISLANLLLLFLLIKKFLYKPVKKVLAERENALGKKYSDADNAKAEALKNQDIWQNKMASLKTEADVILSEAKEDALKCSQQIIEEGQKTADKILKKAEADAQLELKKAEAVIKKEIVDVSSALFEKLVEREMNTQDHQKLINQFLSETGDEK